MTEVTGLTGNHRFRLELIEITKKLAPEKLGEVLESLSPVGLSDLMHSRCDFPVTEIRFARSKGKELLEQALSIFK